LEPHPAREHLSPVGAAVALAARHRSAGWTRHAQSVQRKRSRRSELAHGGRARTRRARVGHAARRRIGESREPAVRQHAAQLAHGYARRAVLPARLAGVGRGAAKRFVLAACIFALATWALPWPVIPILAALMVLAAPRAFTPLMLACAAGTAWAGILAWTAFSAPLGILAAELGGIIHAPGAAL